MAPCAPVGLLAFADIAVGQKYGAGERMDAAAMDVFQSLSGDTNPLHTDVVAARLQGFPDRTVYGFLMLSLLSRIVGTHFQNAVCAALSVDFSHPAFCDDPVTVEAEITHVQAPMRSAVLKFRISTPVAVAARGKLTIKFLAGGVS